MSVLGRSELEASSLADLHVIASELGIDGFRRLRKADLVGAIMERQGGESAGGGAEAVEAVETVEAETTDKAATTDEAEETGAEGDATAPSPRGRRRGGRRGRRGAGRVTEDNGGTPDAKPADRELEAPPAQEPDERVVEGVVELLGGGSGFVRVAPPEPSDEDVYVSAAQIRRCELVDGDTVTGPIRAPRRSERYPSLIRVNTINGTPADEVSAGTRYEELPAAFPEARLALGGEDPTVKAIEWLAPFGRGSRVTIVGPAQAGKSEALRRIAAALFDQEGLTVSVVLAGVRPEETAQWREGPTPPAAAITFDASADAQAQAVERAVDQAKRLAARGGDAVVLVDGLDGVHPPAARKILAAARNIAKGGSLTILATSTRPVGGETTVIALDAALTSTQRFPALDLVASGTLRPELLVGDAGAEAIAKARAEAVAAAGAAR
ncbi:MAG: Rho termination factor N-terminal domain-containing protein [Solirubrobacteraceae bacterium]